MKFLLYIALVLMAMGCQTHFKSQKTKSNDSYLEQIQAQLPNESPQNLYVDYLITQSLSKDVFLRCELVDSKMNIILLVYDEKNEKIFIESTQRLIINKKDTKGELVKLNKILEKNHFFSKKEKAPYNDIVLPDGNTVYVVIYKGGDATVIKRKHLVVFGKEELDDFKKLYLYLINKFTITDQLRIDFVFEG